MKEKIKEVLKRYENMQVNLGSEVARDILAEEILSALDPEKETKEWLDKNDKTSECGGV